MKFEDYMSLKEDFNNAPESKNFGDPTPTSKKVNTVETSKSDGSSWNDNKAALKEVKEACEYILYMIESELGDYETHDIEFGEDKLDKPSKEGFGAAVEALKKFANAGDGKNFSIPDVTQKYKFNKDDEVSTVKEAWNSIMEEAGDEDDEFLTVDKNGIDTNTIVPHNSEKAQFSQSTDISDDMFDNSNIGLDDEW